MANRRSKSKSKAPTAGKAPAGDAWTRGQIICATVFVIVLAMMDFSVRSRDAADKSVDFQVIIKLAVWGLAAAWIAVNFKRYVAPLISRASVPWLILSGWLMVTALYSAAPVLTLVSGGSMILMTLLWMGGSKALGERRLVQVMFWAMVATCAASLVYWMVNPQMALEAVRIGGDRIATTRLQGFTNQPNVLGRAAAFALLISLLYFDTFRRRLKWYVLAPMAVTVATLVLTQSRTSALACMLAAAYFYLLRSKRAWLAPVLVGVVALAALILAPYADQLAIAVARTGDSSEIYTATNRVYIWRLVTWMVEQKPILGWGYNTDAFHLATFSKQISPELGTYVPPNAHNAYLELAFGGGAIAVVLFLVSTAFNGWSAFKHRHQRVQAFMLFWLATSFTEVAGFTGVVTVSTVTMILPIALAALAESRLAAKQPVRRKSSSSSARSAPEKDTLPREEKPKASDEEPPPPRGAASIGAVKVEDLG